MFFFLHVIRMLCFKNISTLLILGLSLYINTSNLKAKTPGLISVELLKGWQNADGNYMAALEIELDHGWKTYWHTPGEAGMRPKFDYARSQNTDNIKFLWPAPILLGDKKIWYVGYKDRLTLPFVLTPQDRSTLVRLELTAIIGICKEICVPVEFTVSEILKPGLDKRSPKIVAALASQPKSKAAAKLLYMNCTFEPTERGTIIFVELKMPQLGEREVIMINYKDTEHWVRTGIAERSGTSLSSQTTIMKKTSSVNVVDPSKATVTVISETSAADLGSCTR